MSTRISPVILGAMVAFFTVSLGAQTAQIAATGFVTDTLAGKRGASPTYKDAAKKNVVAGMAKYAIYDEKTKSLYILEPQENAINYLGQYVTVTGTLAASPMRSADESVDPKTGAVKSFHPVVPDSTPIAGELTITSVASAQMPGATGQ